MSTPSSSDRNLDIAARPPATVRRAFASCIWSCILLLVVAAGEASAVLPGQVIVDPQNPAWMVYNRDSNGDGALDPFFMCAPGDPEDFLYRGSRNADGTRNGDQMAIIDALQEHGGNGIYFQAVRSHGGDGSESHNPFVDSDPSKGLDQDILDQWEKWFAEMDENGITIYFFFYDDTAQIWESGSTVTASERDFLESLVNRFEHHAHLIWVVGEEYAERYPHRRIKDLAAIIRNADENRHPIAVHQNAGNRFDFPDDPNIDQFAQQAEGDSPTELHAEALEAVERSNGRFNVALAEAASHVEYVTDGRRGDLRRSAWAAAMAGAYVMQYGMWSTNDTGGAAPSKGMLSDCRRMQRFFEATEVNTMAPHDELAAGGTRWLLANPGRSYVAYSPASGTLGVEGLPAGSYHLTWLDPVSGATQAQSVDHGGGDASWTKPPGFGPEVALSVEKRNTSRRHDKL